MGCPLGTMRYLIHQEYIRRDRSRQWNGHRTQVRGMDYFQQIRVSRLCGDELRIARIPASVVVLKCSKGMHDMICTAVGAPGYNTWHGMAYLESYNTRLDTLVARLIPGEDAEHGYTLRNTHF